MRAMWPSHWAMASSPSSGPDRPRRSCPARPVRRPAHARGDAALCQPRTVERGLPLQIRVGLNTGEVVVRSIRTDDLHTDYVPIGHATGLAARLQSVANPGSIVVSASTFRLTDGFFAFNALGAAQIKG